MSDIENYDNEKKYSPEKPSFSIEECVAKADELIHKNGACLMLMDIINSQDILNSTDHIDDFYELINDLNTILDEYLPENDLTAPGRIEKGFNIILGDGVTAGIDDSQAIVLAAEYAEEFYPQLPFRYGIAEDGFDNDNVRLIK